MRISGPPEIGLDALLLVFEMPTSEWWTLAQDGRLAPAGQAKLWGLTVMADKLEVKIPAKEAASIVTKVGGGNPSERAVQQWQETFRADPEWYPSKTKDDAVPPGRKPIFTAQKKQVRVAEAGIEYQKGSFIKEALVFRFP